MNRTPYPHCRSRRVNLFYPEPARAGLRFGPRPQSRRRTALASLNLAATAHPVRLTRLFPPRAFCHPKASFQPQCSSMCLLVRRRASTGYPSAFPSIFNALIFSELQIHFFANSLFSHRSKTPGCTGSTSLPARLSWVTNHKSRLFKKLPSLALLFAALLPLVSFIFSSLQTLFCRPRGWGWWKFSPNRISNLQTLFFQLQQGSSVSGPQRRISNQPVTEGSFEAIRFTELAGSPREDGSRNTGPGWLGTPQRRAAHFD